jgi:hypothetical protein
MSAIDDHVLQHTPHIPGIAGRTTIPLPISRLKGVAESSTHRHVRPSISASTQPSSRQSRPDSPASAPSAPPSNCTNPHMLDRMRAESHIGHSTPQPAAIFPNELTVC